MIVCESTTRFIENYHVVEMNVTQIIYLKLFKHSALTGENVTNTNWKI